LLIYSIWGATHTTAWFDKVTNFYNAILNSASLLSTFKRLCGGLIVR